MDRIFQLFDEDTDGAITFVEFICGLSILSTKGSLDEKIQCEWRHYGVAGMPPTTQPFLPRPRSPDRLTPQRPTGLVAPLVP